MKVLCLVDWPVKPGDRWLWKYLPSNEDEVDFISAGGAMDRFPKWGKLVAYYPAYWRLALRALRQTRRKKYDVVVAWEGKNGFPYAVLRSLTGRQDPPLVILTFIYRGMIRHFRPLAQFGLRSVSRLTVTTPFELDYYRKVLSLSTDQIALCPFPWYDSQWMQPLAAQTTPDRFILASGRSYRDYATLARAVQGLDVKVVILARGFNLEGIDFPNNVETRDLLPLRDYQMLLHQSQFLVVPLMDVPHSSGDSHIAQAMSAGKAIIASRTPSPEAYIDAGRNGLLVDPGNVDQLREAILRLWNNPSEAAEMGSAARRYYEQNLTFETVAQCVHHQLLEISCHAQPA